MISAPMIPSGSFMGLVIRRLISAKQGLILIQGSAVRRPNSESRVQFLPGFLFRLFKSIFPDYFLYSSEDIQSLNCGQK